MYSLFFDFTYVYFSSAVLYHTPLACLPVLKCKNSYRTMIGRGRESELLVSHLCQGGEKLKITVLEKLLHWIMFLCVFLPSGPGVFQRCFRVQGSCECLDFYFNFKIGLKLIKTVVEEIHTWMCFIPSFHSLKTSIMLLCVVRLICVWTQPILKFLWLFLYL